MYSLMDYKYIQTKKNKMRIITITAVGSATVSCDTYKSSSAQGNIIIPIWIRVDVQERI